MFSLYRILLASHDLNHGLALIIGAWAVAQILLGSRGQRIFTPSERRFVILFTGILYLQAALGLLLVAVMQMQNLSIFAGRSGVLWWHMAGGVLAIMFGTLAIALSRTATTNNLQHLGAAICSGLALLALGNLLGIVVLLGLSLLIQFVIPKLRNDHPIVKRSGGSVPEEAKR